MFGMEASRPLERMNMELKKHWDEKHDIVEDMFVFMNCEERLFICRTCKKIYICSDNGEEIKVKEELPITLTNKETAEKLTWLPEF